jgi:hypothetical protein
MNLDFYIYGTPNGYNQYPADEKSQLLREFANNSTSEAQLVIHRKGHLVYYAYLRYISTSSFSKYLGFCLVFNDNYCKNTRKLFELFERAYNDVMLKAELLHFEYNGKVIFTINKFIEKELEVQRIKNFFITNIENEFTKDFENLSPSFKVGNGIKTLSINNTNRTINSSFREYDSVYLLNKEKSDSELERVYKMYAQVSLEKQELSDNYNQLLGQKKQYKIVTILFLLLIAAGMGLYTFNSNLEEREYKISSLNNDLEIGNNTINSLNDSIKDLNLKKKQLFEEKMKLFSNLMQIEEQKNNLFEENELLINKVEELENDNNRLLSRISNLNYDISYWKNKASTPSYNYYTTINKAEIYYKVCAKDEYTSASCHYKKNATITVYKIVGGYGLTDVGYVRMSDLKN